MPAREERSNGSVEANGSSTGGVMIAGGHIAAIAADRAEMALARAVLSTSVEFPAAFLGWDAGIVRRFVVKRAMVKGGI